MAAGLEAHVIEQGRFGEVCPGDLAGMMNALPPAHEVQQTVRVAVQTLVRKAADILAIEEAVDPSDASAGRLLYRVIRAVCARCVLLAKDAEVYGWAASTRDWNWSASPP